MLQRWLLVVTTFFFPACVSSANSDLSSNRQEITGLTEMSIDYIKDVWGQPDYDLPKTKGRLVKFKNVRVLGVNPDTGEEVPQQCTVQLQLNKEGLVSEWEYQECRYILADGKIGGAVQNFQMQDGSSEDVKDIDERVDPKFDDLDMQPR